MAGNGWDGWEKLEMAENSWKWPEMAENNLQRLKLLFLDRNGCKWLEWSKWLDIAGNG